MRLDNLPDAPVWMGPVGPFDDANPLYAHLQAVKARGPTTHARWAIDYHHRLGGGDRAVAMEAAARERGWSYLRWEGVWLLAVAQDRGAGGGWMVVCADYFVDIPTRRLVWRSCARTEGLDGALAWHRVVRDMIQRGFGPP